MALLQKLWQRLIRCFLAGLFAILPLVVTVGIVIWVAGFVRQYIGPGTFLGRRLQGVGIQFAGEGGETTAYLFGWIAVLLTIFGLGVLLEMGAKRYFGHLLEWLFRRIPFVNSVYTTSKQMIDLLDKEGGDAQLKGMSPVMCHFGDGASPAVPALLASAETYLLRGEEYRIVVIPTAPIPFGGALLLIPSRHVEPLDMTVDALINIYVSMGITAPQFLEVKPKATSKP